jgi:hypothetical protein
MECAVCSALSDGDCAELTRFVLDTLESHSLATLHEQVPPFVHMLEARHKQTHGAPPATAYDFSPDQIHEHIQFCIATHEDTVLRVVLKQRLLRAMNDAQNIPQLVAITKMLQQTLTPTRKPDA